LVLFVISALSMLAIDGGELFMLLRQIVKATNAGMIAAAQWCAQSVGTAQTDTITTRADQTATANISSATRTAGLDFSNGPTSPGQPPSQWGWSASQCNGGGTAGYVRATYGVSATQAFHLGGNRLVHATAIAQWGTAGGGSGVAPMALQEGRLSNCNITPGNFPPPGTTCAFWFDSNDLGHASWGWADLGSGWDVLKTAGCSGTGASQINSWITGSAVDLSLNYPEPTYVCVIGGLKTSDMSTMASEIGKVYAFPVNDPCHITPPAPSGAIHGQVNASGVQVCPPTTPAKWDIIGWASMKLVGVDRGNSGGIAKCTPPIGQGGVAGSANGYCITTQWIGYQAGGSLPGSGGANFGTEAVGLAG